MLLFESVCRRALDFLLLDDEGLVCQLQDAESAVEVHTIGEALCQPDALGERDLLLIGVVGVEAGVNTHVLKVKIGEATLLCDDVGEREAAEDQVEMNVGVVGLIVSLLAVGGRHVLKRAGI